MSLRYMQEFRNFLKERADLPIHPVKVSHMVVLLCVCCVYNTFEIDEGFIALEQALSDFWTVLPIATPPMGGSFMNEGFAYSLMTLRTLVHAAMVQLHRQLSLKELSSHAKSLTAAEHVITIIREHWDADFAYFDPMLGVSARIFVGTRTFPRPLYRQRGCL